MRSHLIALTLGAALLACTPSANAAGNPPVAHAAPSRVTGAEARKLVAAGALLVDVRSAEEFAEGHIEGARNIPLDTLDRVISSLAKDKTIVVYCHSGARSEMAATHLAAAGYVVRNLGPKSAW